MTVSGCWEKKDDGNGKGKRNGNGNGEMWGIFPIRLRSGPE
jgi:hypothetical protein